MNSLLLVLGIVAPPDSGAGADAAAEGGVEPAVRI